ncbi:hypothetical protein BV20DRAFT_1055125 [Pilatotrama ljubarskyi]|nr:hypothetical protein BV20DRAFT_1055125 [Pilatotrama ljubarskyi]
MALYLGVPCGIAVQLILDGVIETPGVIAPYSKEICDPIREILEAQGMGLVEKVLTQLVSQVRQDQVTEQSGFGVGAVVRISFQILRIKYLLSEAQNYFCKVMTVMAVPPFLTEYIQGDDGQPLLAIVDI